MVESETPYEVGRTADAAAESSGSLDRALDLLFHLRASPAPLGVTAAARGAGLPKSSAHRLLQALARRGLVERDERGRYRPGFALIALGLGALEGDPLVALARPVLEGAARDLGETVFLCGARGGAPMVLDKAEGSGFLRAAPQIGTRVPVHATAVGRLFLAFAPGDVAVGPEPFEAFAPTTPRSAAELQPRVAAARARGLAENRGDWIAGLWVLAAPILEGGAHTAAASMRGAVAVAAPESRMAAMAPSRAGERIQAAAAAIAARLGGSSG